MRPAGAELIQAFEGAATKLQRGEACRRAQHFDVVPADAVPPAGAERFHGGFLGSESRSIAFHFRGAAFAISNLRFSKDTVTETLAAPREDFLNPRNLYDIDADGDNHRY